MFDIEDLIEPIDGENPAGRDLRLDAGDLTFQALKDYTTVVDAAVAESESEVREANWSGVESLCVSALREKSKDLELIASLAQAWAHTNGSAGVRHGLDLVHRSLRQFWDSIHPGVDPDDGEISLPLRARWLNWLDAPNGFIKAVKQGPLLSPRGGGHFSWQDHENSALLDDATLSPERRQELVDAGVMAEGQWSAALAGIGATAIGEIVEALEGARETAREIAAFCADRFGDEDAPDFYNLRNTLEEMCDYLRPHAGGDAPTHDDTGAVVHAPGGAAVASSGPIGSRAQALRALQDVGDYFRRTEPHSPISYLITRAVRWGSMPLDQLLRDVIRNDDVIGHIWETLGLDERPNAASADDGGDDY